MYEAPGITDTAGSEIWQPSRKFTLATSWDKSLYWIFEGRDTGDMLFNKITGVQTLYRQIDRDGPGIGNSRYMYMRDSVHPFLLNYETGYKIALTKAYESSFRKENGYLFATYQEYDTVLKRYQKRVDIFEDKERLPPVLEGEYGWPLFLYKEGTVQKIFVDPVPFDAVVFSQGNRHNLYDKNMKLVKRFVLGKARTQDLLKESARILGFKVDNMYTTLHPDEERQYTVPLEAPPERFYPMIAEAKDKNGGTTVVLKKTDAAFLPLFTVAASKRVQVRGRGQVSIIDKSLTRRCCNLKWILQRVAVCCRSSIGSWEV